MSTTNDTRRKLALNSVSEAIATAGVDTPLTELAHRIVGSTYIRDSEDSDIDVLVYLRQCDTKGGVPVETVGARLHLNGWAYGGSEPDFGEDNFASFKRVVCGITVNLILVYDQTYFEQWVQAAEVCRFLHLMGVPYHKGTTHGIHEIIMDGSSAEAQASVRDYN